jgi:hypothetical protein
MLRDTRRLGESSIWIEIARCRQCRYALEVGRMSEQLRSAIRRTERLELAMEERSTSRRARALDRARSDARRLLLQLGESPPPPEPGASGPSPG